MKRTYLGLWHSDLPPVAAMLLLAHAAHNSAVYFCKVSFSLSVCERLEHQIMQRMTHLYSGQNMRNYVLQERYTFEAKSIEDEHDGLEDGRGGKQTWRNVAIYVRVCNMNTVQLMISLPSSPFRGGLTKKSLSGSASAPARQQ